MPGYSFRMAVPFALVLCFAAVASAQKTADPSQLIKISTTLDVDIVTRQKPAIATVTIENVSGRGIDLKSICSFEMRSTNRQAVARNYSVFGDSYWSPVDLETGQPLKLNIIDPNALKKGIVVGRVPEDVLHFTKNEMFELVEASRQVEKPTSF